MDPSVARALWHRLEAVNAVTYFCDECRQAPAALGMRGFWMGYFACRAAPMGPVAAGVVEATFANFHPDRVRRALPDAWSYAEPEAVLDARAGAAAAALRRLLPHGQARRVATEAAPTLRAAVAAGAATGRPLFVANRDMPAPDDPVADLWQLATTMREHRGDGHVAVLVAEGLHGCEPHVLFAAETGADPDLYLRSRGWSAQDWEAATERLAARGLLAGGALTAAGAALRKRIEDRTDELAAAPLRAVGEAGAARLIELLSEPAQRISGSGEISFPNPMGLPAPG